MQEFADASGGAWFEFDGDFARWCLESGHHVALDPEQVGVDEARPTFTVEARVNRSGRMVVPTYVRIGDQKLYYIDDVAGETGRMHSGRDALTLRPESPLLQETCAQSSSPIPSPSGRGLG